MKVRGRNATRDATEKNLQSTSITAIRQKVENTAETPEQRAARLHCEGGWGGGTTRPNCRLSGIGQLR